MYTLDSLSSVGSNLCACRTMNLELTNQRNMNGWERLTSACGLGCKVFWSPWAHSEKSPYDPVLKLDELDVIESCDTETVTSAPHKPDWGDLSTVRAPIVKNRVNSVTNLARSGSSYEKLPATDTVPKLNNKRVSKPELTGSRGSLTGPWTGSKSSLAGSNTINKALEVRQMVTTV